jgi:hypothetical protein
LPNETKEQLKKEASEYIKELENSDIHCAYLIIEMTEAYIKFFNKDTGGESSAEKLDDLKFYYKNTEALDDIRGQSLKKMIPLTYKAMYEIEKK